MLWDLVDALKKKLGQRISGDGRRFRKVSAGQKKMLLPIEGKKPAAKKALS
jgi:DNA end-binding protein Ku